MSTGIGDAAAEHAVTQAAFRMSVRQWMRLLHELERRGEQRRESGAFLLAGHDSDRVTRIAYYDDLDAHCLTGGISFASAGFTELWRLCRAENLRVVADVHTHPGRGVQQSDIDATNPMIARVGHVALTVPSYGSADHVQECGVHVYLGDRRWFAVPVNRVDSVVQIFGVLSRVGVQEIWTLVVRRIGRLGRGER